MIVIEFDPVKCDANVRSRGLSFERAVDFDFAGAVIKEDARRDYSEVRYVAVGMLAYRLHVLCFSARPGGIRVISFRKANPREVSRYAKARPP